MGVCGKTTAIYYNMNIVLAERPSRFALSGGPPYTREASSVPTTDVVCCFALFVGARKVVEAGTHEGHTSLAIAAALQGAELGGHIWTADVFERYPKGIVKQAVEPQGLEGVFTFYHGDFEKMLNSYDLRDIDLAYLDASSPERPNLRREHCMAVRSRMRKGGLILVDDCAGCWPDAEWFRRNATLYLPQQRGLAVLGA